MAGSVKRPLQHVGDEVPDIQEEISEALIFISDQHTPLIMSVSRQEARKMRQVQPRHLALTGRQVAPNPNQTKPNRRERAFFLMLRAPAQGGNERAPGGALGTWDPGASPHPRLPQLQRCSCYLHNTQSFPRAQQKMTHLLKTSFQLIKFYY